MKKNDSLNEEDRKMHFRIGVNLGDVVEEDGRIYGNGVNIAARLEGLAEPGGICLSRTAFDHVVSKLDIGYEYLGEHKVKNITASVRVYRVLMGAETAGKVIGEKKKGGRISPKIGISAAIILLIFATILFYWESFPFGSRKIEETHIGSEQVSVTSEGNEEAKTIAVLPFDDLSPEKDQEYFVLGLSEEILNSISKISGLHVASKTSSFAFKNSDKTIKEIADILEREYILEGSVRKADDALRITAQLINVADDRHLWSETYDRELKDVFKIQEDIAKKVADRLKLTLGGVPIERTEKPEIYERNLKEKGKRNARRRVLIEHMMSDQGADPAEFMKNLLKEGKDTAKWWENVDRMLEDNGDDSSNFVKFLQKENPDSVEQWELFERMLEDKVFDSIQHIFEKEKEEESENLTDPIANGEIE
jgi:adenylate cyclase